MRNIALKSSLVIILSFLSLGSFAASGAMTWEIVGDKVFMVYPDGTTVEATGGVCKTS
jgi:hypothetical protein